jgi:hypothetical protein
LNGVPWYIEKNSIIASRRRVKSRNVTNEEHNIEKNVEYRTWGGNGILLSTLECINDGD